MVAVVFSVLLCLWAGCSTREGVVLIASEPDSGDQPDTSDEPDAQPNEDAGSDDAGQDAGDSELRDSGPDTLGHCRIGGSKDGFYETFTGSALDANRWLVAHGPATLGARSAPFARDNVNLDNGTLRLFVRGDQYTGPARSVDRDGRPLASGKRSVAALVSRDLFASATYQVQGHFVGPSGVEVAIWFARDDERAGAISLATPGFDNSAPSYAFVHMQTHDGSSAFDHDYALPASLDDRASHILRFDWYTTNDNAAAFWTDDARRFQSTKNLPSREAGRLWIVAWLREGASAAFDTAEFQIDSAFVTPFGNDGDVCLDGALAGPFLSLP